MIQNDQAEDILFGRFFGVYERILQNFMFIAIFC